MRSLCLRRRSPLRSVARSVDRLRGLPGRRPRPDRRQRRARSARRCCACTTRRARERDAADAAVRTRGCAGRRPSHSGGHGRGRLLQPHRRGGATFVERILDAGYAQPVDDWVLGENLAWGTGRAGHAARRDGGVDGLAGPPAHDPAPRLPRGRLRDPARRPARRRRRRDVSPPTSACGTEVIRPTLLILAALALPRCSPPAGRAQPSTRDDARELADVNLAAAVADAQAQAGGAGRPRRPPGAATARPRRHRARRVRRRTARRSRSSTRTRPTARTASPAGRTRCRPTSRSCSATSAAQSGGTKALRFDMGTRCGPEYVDIQIVALPGPRSQLRRRLPRGRRRRPGARSATPAARATRSILADALSTTAVEYGLAETIMGAAGERPGAANPHNRGGLTAVLFTRDGVEPPGPGARGWWPEGFLHEITHTLGAVQWSAPHSTQPAGAARTRATATAGRAPTSCVTPRTPAPRSSCRSTAPPVDGAITESYDCGRDDYFNPAPAAGQLPRRRTGTSTTRRSCAACAGDRAGVRRRRSCGAPRAAGRDVRPGDRGRARAAAPRCGRSRGTGSTSRPLRATSGSASPAAAGATSRRRRSRATSPATRDLGRRLRVTGDREQRRRQDRGGLGADRAGRRRRRQPHGQRALRRRAPSRPAAGGSPLRTSVAPASGEPNTSPEVAPK